MFKRTFLIFVMTVAMAPAFADTVEEATERYFRIMESGDYAATAALFDPNELKRFRSSLEFLATLPNASQAEIYGAFFGAGSTVESVSELSDVEFFASFFAFAMAQSGVAELMRGAKTEYLGHVMEGDNVAHAVTRISVSSSEFESENMSVASFVRRDGQWKMKMSGDIRGVAENIRRAIAQ